LSIGLFCFNNISAAIPDNPLSAITLLGSIDVPVAIMNGGPEFECLDPMRSLPMAAV
jgi:hypothetical protein